MTNGMWARDQAYQEGAKHARDVIVAAIIGLQNDDGNQSSDTYRAYQRLLELIVARHGDLFERFKG